MATITSPRAQSPAPRITSPSIAETPTSSTRGSFELASRTQTGPVPAGARRGNRAALRDYYNLKAKAQGPGQGQLSRTTSITSTTSDLSTAQSAATLTDDTSTTSALTAPLDNEQFDSQAYLSDLLQSSSLKDILRVEATLVSEIRNLSGETKGLVYDNYSKLITAVGTIGEMQRSMNNTPGGGLSEVGELEGKMGELRTLVRTIATSGNEDQKQAAVENRRVRRAAKDQERKKELVKWVLDAPTRLQRMISEDRETDAEKEWNLIRTYLDEWNGVKGVIEVRKACEDIMAVSEVEDENLRDNG